MDILDEASQLLRSGQIDAAQRLLETCRRDPAQDDAGRLRVWLLTATAHDQAGAFEGAIEAADLALTLARRHGCASGEAEALYLRGAASLKLGLTREAIEATAASLSRARAAGDARVEAMALRVMSNLALHHGDLDEARALLDDSLASARRAGDDETEFWALNNITNLLGLRAARLAEAGDRAGARAEVDELVRVVGLALQVSDRTGHWMQRAFALSNLADAWIVDGDHARARALVRDYSALARQGGSPRLLAYANLDEVRMLRAEGRLDAAVAAIDCDEHRRLLSCNDDLALVTETALYELHKAAGRFDRALGHHEVASRMNAERLSRKAEQQVGVMMARLDLEQARSAAERARLDAELIAQRAQVLELEREQLRRVAHEDPLTGIGNRRAADETLARLLADVGEGGGACVALVDIDHFKAINDSHGHAIGDAVLAALGRLMRQGLRSRDQVFRYGGEEFLLVLADASPEACADVCDRLRLAIERHDWSRVAPRLAVTASFGLARHAGAQESAGSLVQRADEALYVAKHGGRNRVALA